MFNTSAWMIVVTMSILLGQREKYVNPGRVVVSPLLLWLYYPHHHHGTPLHSPKDQNLP
jgi:hypothetical protein